MLVHVCMVLLAMFFLGTSTAQQQYVSKTSSHCVCFPSPSKAAATTQHYVSEAQPGRHGDKNLQAKLIRHGPAKEHVRQISATNLLADFNNGTCLTSQHCRETLHWMRFQYDKPTQKTLYGIPRIPGFHSAWQEPGGICLCLSKPWICQSARLYRFARGKGLQLILLVLSWKLQENKDDDDVKHTPHWRTPDVTMRPMYLTLILLQGILPSCKKTRHSYKVWCAVVKLLIGKSQAGLRHGRNRAWFDTPTQNPW